MTIHEILCADWNIDRIRITVRNRATTKYIMRYCIGRDVEAGRSERFAYEVEIGDVYENSGMKTLYIRRIIQHCQQENLPSSRSMLMGVLIEKIPRELAGLMVSTMSPYNYGGSKDLHGYSFDCYVDSWGGIDGENKQIELEELT